MLVGQEQPPDAHNWMGGLPRRYSILENGPAPDLANQDRPSLPADHLTLEPEWDIQVVGVGLTPLAPTTFRASETPGI